VNQGQYNDYGEYNLTHSSCPPLLYPDFDITTASARILPFAPAI
jgi:hypothetical protein